VFVNSKSEVIGRCLQVYKFIGYSQHMYIRYDMRKIIKFTQVMWRGWKNKWPCT